VVIQQEHADLPRCRAAAAVRLACHRDHLTVRRRLRDLPHIERSRCSTQA
jgi:hypothetical protein